MTSGTLFDVSFVDSFRQKFRRKNLSLIRAVAVRMKKAWILSYPLNAQQRHGSDRVDAQADLTFSWAHSHFVGFVMRQLILFKRIVQVLSNRKGFPFHNIYYNVIFEPRHEKLTWGFPTR